MLDTTVLIGPAREQPAAERARDRTQPTTEDPNHFPMPELDVEHWPVGE
jgi:hypothetical protein